MQVYVLLPYEECVFIIFGIVDSTRSSSRINRVAKFERVRRYDDSHDWHRLALIKILSVGLISV